MKTKTVVLAGAVLIVAAGVMWQLVMRTPSAGPAAATIDFSQATLVAYENATGQRFEAEFVGDKARVSGAGLDAVVLTQVESSSGARYEGEAGVVLFNTGSNITVTQAEQPLFEGQEVGADNDGSTGVNGEIEEGDTLPIRSDELPAPVTLLDGTQWYWVSAGGTSGAVKEATSLTGPEGKDIYTLSFTGKQVSIVTTCNSAESTYTQSGNEVTVGAFPIPATLMACKYGQLSELRGVLDSSTVSVTVFDKTLTITHPKGYRLVFERK